MKLVSDSMSDAACPHCGKKLSVDATWECDPPPYPDATVNCPECDKPIQVTQRVVATLEKA